MPSYGHPIGTAIEKRTATLKYWFLPHATYGSPSLLGIDVTGIHGSGSGYGATGLIGAPGTTADFEDHDAYRQRHQVTLKSLRFIIHAENLFVNRECIFHWALVCPKQPPASPDAGINAAQIRPTGFFRDYYTKRSVDFHPLLDGSTINSSPINDDYHHVLLHEKFPLGPNSLTSPQNHYDANSKNFIEIDRVVPINRQLRYTGRRPYTCTTPIFVCFWLCPIDHIGSANIISNVFTLKFKCEADWYEPGDKYQKKA